MLSVFSATGDGLLPCPKESSPPITSDCYTISLKKVVRGEVNYGRTKYDFTNGALVFVAPRQVLQWDSAVAYDRKGFAITFHEDFIRGTPLAQQVKRYGFFSYSANEALHLSPKEEKQVEAIVESIDLEYRGNQDAFSKDIIIAHLTTLLKYADRFYERQFVNREEMSSQLSERFAQTLSAYFDSGQLQTLGIPSIAKIAEELSVTQRYLSDTLKRDTGKTSTEHLQAHLIDVAKELLLDPGKAVSDVAYQLGFEYPSYFSRLFKKQAGVSPSAYRDKYKLN